MPSSDLGTSDACYLTPSDSANLSNGVRGAFLVGLLRDLGAGLEISLYEEAVEHCFGGADRVQCEVAVQLGDHNLGSQRMRLIAPGVAIKLTSLSRPFGAFETHARKLLTHADLRAITWVNIELEKVTFVVIER